LYDKEDFIYKIYKTKQRKSGFARHKLYRVICDICGEKQGYASTRKKREFNYCKKCQYEKLSFIFSKPKFIVNCEICGKEIEYCESQYIRAEKHYCSKICVGIGSRKDIEEVERSGLKDKMIQAGMDLKCTSCGHDNLWNLQAHHKIFVSDGGGNNIENLEFLCRNCHYDLHHYSGKDKKEKKQ
jgi:5-methylcytosine-specific restriction endonuclease McrA